MGKLLPIVLTSIVAVATLLPRMIRLRNKRKNRKTIANPIIIRFEPDNTYSDKDKRWWKGYINFVSSNIAFNVGENSHTAEDYPISVKRNRRDGKYSFETAAEDEHRTIIETLLKRSGFRLCEATPSILE